MDILSYVPEWLLTHGAALIVVVPLIMGAILAVMPSARLAWGLVLIVSLICAATGFVLVVQVYGGDQITYAMGGWDPPHGIGYVIDQPCFNSEL